MPKDAGLTEIRFKTLGDFDILVNEKSLLANTAKRSGKILTLLKLFVTYKDKNILPTTIVDQINSDADLGDPKNALRTQIYRLRQMLNKICAQEFHEQEKGAYYQLSFQNGYYKFSLHEGCTLDVEDFLNYIREGNLYFNTDPYKSMFFYQNVLNIYQGEYLAEDPYSDWIIPIRNRYHRLYIGALQQLLELFKGFGNYEEIMETCEGAFVVEPYEETINIFYLEALIEMGWLSQANTYYRYITDKLYRDLGVKPSAALREIHRKLPQRNRNQGKNRQSITEVINYLRESEPLKTAYYCDHDEFRAIYNLEKRKIIRGLSHSLLGMVSLKYKEKPIRFQENNKYLLKRVRNVLLHSLRKSDVLTQWHDGKFLFILSSVSKEQLGSISKRINQAYDRETDMEEILLELTFYSIQEEIAFL